MTQRPLRKRRAKCRKPPTYRMSFTRNKRKPRAADVARRLRKYEFRPFNRSSSQLTEFKTIYKQPNHHFQKPKITKPSNQTLTASLLKTHQILEFVPPNARYNSPKSKIPAPRIYIQNRSQVRLTEVPLAHRQTTRIRTFRNVCFTTTEILFYAIPHLKHQLTCPDVTAFTTNWVPIIQYY